MRLAGVACLHGEQPEELHLRQVVGHYLARLDPDGAEPDPTEQRSFVTARDAHGMVTGRFVLDAIGGEKVLAAALWDGSLPEASDPHTGAPISRPWFGWPGAAAHGALGG